MRLAYAFALIVLTAAPAASQEETVQIGGMEVNIARDPITDESSSGFFATEKTNDDLTLMVFCSEDGPQVGLSHKYLGGDRDDDIRFTYRFDDSPAVGPRDSRLSSSNRSSFPFLSDMRRATEFINTAKTSTQVALRVTDPLDGEIVTSIVQLDGFAEALERIDCSTPD